MCTCLSASAPVGYVSTVLYLCPPLGMSQVYQDISNGTRNLCIDS